MTPQWHLVRYRGRYYSLRRIYFLELCRRIAIGEPPAPDANGVLPAPIARNPSSRRNLVDFDLDAPEWSAAYCATYCKTCTTYDASTPLDQE